MEVEAVEAVVLVLLDLLRVVRLLPAVVDSNAGLFSSALLPSLAGSEYLAKILVVLDLVVLTLLVVVTIGLSFAAAASSALRRFGLVVVVLDRVVLVLGVLVVRVVLLV